VNHPQRDLRQEMVSPMLALHGHVIHNKSFESSLRLMSERRFFKRKRVAITLHRDDLKQFGAISAKQGVPTARLVRQAMREFLERGAGGLVTCDNASC
jgi:hypothetical protein